LGDEFLKGDARDPDYLAGSLDTLFTLQDFAGL
jgi:hypothetical protein